MKNLFLLILLTLSISSFAQKKPDAKKVKSDTIIVSLGYLSERVLLTADSAVRYSGDAFKKAEAEYVKAQKAMRVVIDDIRKDGNVPDSAIVIKYEKGRLFFKIKK